MPYDEPKFLNVGFFVAPTFAAKSQVFTASDHVVTTTYATPDQIPFGAAAFVVDGVVQIDTVGTSKDAYIVLLQSGTTVVATAAPGNTAGSNGTFVQLATAIIPSGGVLAVAIKGTGTASATQTSPVLRINLGVRRGYA